MPRKDDRPEPAPPPDAPSAPAAAPTPGTTSDKGSAAPPKRAPARPPAERRRTVYVERRSGFFVRWLKRLAALVLLFLLLLVLLFLGATLVLRSDVPRSLGESGASKALGLNVALGSVDIGWGGDITVTDLVLRLPSPDGQGEKVLEVPRLVADVGMLPIVAFTVIRGGQPQVHSLEVESPVVYMTQDQQDQWTLVRAAGLLANRGPRPPDQPRQHGLPPLPKITLTGGQVIVRDKAGHQRVIEGLELHGDRRSPLVYTLEGGVGEAIAVAGQLFPSSGLRQEIRLTVRNLPELLSPVFTLPPVTLDATWQGGLSAAGGVEGVLDIASATYQQIAARGQLDVVAAGGQLTITPRQPLVVENLPEAVGPVSVMEGTIVAGAARVDVAQLLISAVGGQVLVRHAGVQLDDLAGEIDLAFHNLRAPGARNIEGQLQADLGYDAFGRPNGYALLDASGTFGEQDLQHFKAEITASGPDYHDFRTMDIRGTLLESPVMLGPTRESTVFPRSTALVQLRLADEQRPRIDLASVESLEPELVRLRGQGAYFTKKNPEWEAGQYWLWLEETGYPVKIPRVAERVPLDMGFEIRGQYNPTGGDIAPVEITNIYGTLADVFINGKGWYIIARPAEEGGKVDPPLWLSLVLTRDARIPTPIVPGGRAIITAEAELDEPPGVDDPEDPGTTPETREPAGWEMEPIRGMVVSWLNIGGDPASMVFDGSGGLLTSEFAVGPYALGTVDMQLTARLTSTNLEIHTTRDEELEQFSQAFGSHFEFHADIPFEEQEPGSISLRIDDMLVERVAEAFGLPVVQGTLDGRIDVDLTGLSPQHAVADGAFTFEHLSIPGRIELAERITLRPRLREGVLTIPIEIAQTAVLAPGPTLIGEERTITMNVRYDLSAPRRLLVSNLQAQDYPLVLPATKPGGRYTDAHFTLAAPTISLGIGQEGQPEIRGRLAAEAEVRRGAAPFELEPLAHGELEATATQTRVELETLEAEMPGIGSIVGGGTLQLADIPGRSRIWIHGRDLDLAAAARRFDIPEGAHGILNTSLSIEPGPGDRPQGDVLVNFAFQGTDARWKTVRIDQGQVIAYLSRVPRPDDTPSRGQYDFTLLTTERMRFEVAGGIVDGYLKLRNRGGLEEARGEVPAFELLHVVRALTTLEPQPLSEDWYINATLDAAGLHVGQIAQLFDQDATGRMNLSAIAYGNLSQRPRFPGAEQDAPPFPINGEGSLSVRNGKLRNFNIFQRILDLVNALLQTPQRDSLDANFRLEQGNFYLANLKAYVDGTEIRFAGTLDNVFERELTTIDAQGVVFLRPLAQIPLPFFREADEIFAALQSQATAFRARGPLKDPTVYSVSLAEVGATLRILLAGEGKR